MKVFLTILALVVGVGAFLHLTAPTGAPLEPETISGRVRYVVDGDSLYISSHKPQIRLWGVDAPEKSEAGFQAATDHLSNLVQGRELSCRMIDRDRYGRTVARCFLTDGREVNPLMIESGTASEYLRYSKGFYSR